MVDIVRWQVFHWCLKSRGQYHEIVQLGHHKIERARIDCRNSETMRVSSREGESLG